MNPGWAKYPMRRFVSQDRVWKISTIIGGAVMVAAAIYAMGPLRMGVASAGLVALVAILLSPLAGVYLLVGNLVAAWPYSITKILGLVVVLSVAGWALVNRRQLRMNRFGWLAALLTLWGLLALLWSGNRSDHLKYVLTLASFVALIWVLLMLIDTWSRLKGIVWALVASGVATAVVGTAQIIHPFVLPTSEYLKSYVEDPLLEIQGFQGLLRVDGLAGHPIILAIALQTIAPFVVFPLLRDRSPSRRLLYIGILALFALTWYHTYARTSMICVAIMAFLIASKFGLKGVGILVAIVLLVSPVILFSSSAFSDRVLSVIGLREADTEVDSTVFRLTMWKVALNMMPEYWLGGVGLGNFPKIFRRYLPPGADESILGENQEWVVHNGFLEVAVEMGAAGLALYLATIFVTLAALWQLERRLKDSVHIDLVWATQAAFVGILVANAFTSLEYFRLFWLLVGMTGVMWQIVTTKRGLPAKDIAHG